MRRAAARLFAERGYRGTSAEDIGSACGISGPAVHKHVVDEHAVLATLLRENSELLLQRERAVVDGAGSSTQALVELWVRVLQELDEELSEDAAGTRAHATFGRLDSTPHPGRPRAVSREELVGMALRALESRVPARTSG